MCSRLAGRAPLDAHGPSLSSKWWLPSRTRCCSLARLLLVERSHAHHRDETLLFHETRRVLQVRDHRRQDEEAVRVTLSRLLAFEFSTKLNK